MKFNISLSPIVWLGVFLFGHFPVNIRCIDVAECAGSQILTTFPEIGERCWMVFTYILHETQLAKASTCPYSSKDASMTLDTIEKLVNYYYTKPGTSKGTKGLKVLRGQIRYLLDMQAERLTPNLRCLLEQLKETSDVHLNLMLLDEVATVAMDTKLSNLLTGLNMTQEYPDILTAVRMWHKSDAIAKHFDEFKNIGNEKEVLDRDLDVKCLIHLVRDCRFPQMCQATYQRDIYSQYMLTRQSLLQYIAKKRSCTTAYPETFKNPAEYEERLCSKAFLEAEFLSSHQFPTRFVHLFADYVGTCGLMGYPNFMRVEWLREIISWREGSISGCMADLYGSRKLTDTTVHVPVVGREDGKSEEDCLVHLTSASLMALSMNFRYMVDVCEPSLFDDYLAGK